MSTSANAPVPKVILASPVARHLCPYKDACWSTMLAVTGMNFPLRDVPFSGLPHHERTGAGGSLVNRGNRH